MPTRLEILGVSAPGIRQVVRDVLRLMAAEPPRRILALAKELVRRRIHESRQVGYEVLARRPDAMVLLTASIVE